MSEQTWKFRIDTFGKYLNLLFLLPLLLIFEPIAHAFNYLAANALLWFANFKAAVSNFKVDGWVPGFGAGFELRRRLNGIFSDVHLMKHTDDEVF